MVDTQHFGDTRSSEERRLSDLIAQLRSVLDDVELGILDRSTPGGRRWSLTAAQLLAKARQRSRDKVAVPDRGSRAGKGMGDPVGSRVAHLDDRDPDLVAWRSLHMSLQGMATIGALAVAALAKATPEAQHPAHIKPGRCRVCGDVPIYRGKPEDASERCRWCYDHWCEYGEDMPRRITAWRKQGKAITPAMIRSELGMELVG